jgi:hypothetical protein
LRKYNIAHGVLHKKIHIVTFHAAYTYGGDRYINSFIKWSKTASAFHWEIINKHWLQHVCKIKYKFCWEMHGGICFARNKKISEYFIEQFYCFRILKKSRK